MIDSGDSFSSDYQEAREKFLNAARAAKASLEEYPHPEPGPDGRPLFTDTAWIGPREARRVLVMISATHGVEGFCGSGAQVDWLRRGGAGQLPDDTAVLLIHAINPYGFAWLRRVTHENVDLNRNWVDFDAPLPDNPHYRELQGAILPRTWDEQSMVASMQSFMGFAAEHGLPALQQALSGGQYSDAKGVWYGGTEPTWSRRTMTDIWARHLSHAARIILLDYHTGLGPWGLCEQICSLAKDTPEYARARMIFGAGVVSSASGESTSAALLGDMLAAAPSHLPHAQVTGIALEYGTVPVEAVLTAVRGDAWLHAYGELDSAVGKQIKQQIRDAFYGDRADWKGMVIGQSMLAIRQALASFNEG